VVYETGAHPISMHVEKVFGYDGNVFGTVRPWVSHGIVPGNAHVINHPIIGHDIQRAAARRSYAVVGAGGAVDAPAHVAPPSATGGAFGAMEPYTHETKFVLRWSRPAVGTTITSRAQALLEGATAAGFGAVLTDTTDAIDLPDRGIRLSLYEIQQSGKTIGHAIRYLRAENFSYTRSDVMLFYWSPNG